MPNQLLDVHQISERLGIKLNTVYSWVNQRKIPYVKVGRLVRFDWQDIEKWIEDRKVHVYQYKRREYKRV